MASLVSKSTVGLKRVPSGWKRPKDAIQGETFEVYARPSVKMKLN